MTADGSKVFFTTARETARRRYRHGRRRLRGRGRARRQRLACRLVTTDGGTGPCNPVANNAGATGTTTGATADCSAVAIGGGGGVAPRARDAVYFLSPEAARRRRGGRTSRTSTSRPRTDLRPASSRRSNPDNPVVLDSVHAAAAGRPADFQTTPERRLRDLHRERRELTGIDNAGKRSRCSATTPPPTAAPLDCPSCDPTLTEDHRQNADARPWPTGPQPHRRRPRLLHHPRCALVLDDTDGRARRLRVGRGRASADLLGDQPVRLGTADSASADGTDAYFFTHDTLDAHVDENGAAHEDLRRPHRRRLLRASGRSRRAQPPTSATDRGPWRRRPAADRQLREDQRRQLTGPARKRRVKQRGQVREAEARHAKKAQAGKKHNG